MPTIMCKAISYDSEENDVPIYNGSTVIGADRLGNYSSLNKGETSTTTGPQVLADKAGLSLASVSAPKALGASTSLFSLVAPVAGLKRFTIIPDNDAVGYYAFGGAASSGTAKLPVGVMSRDCNPDDYAQIYVYGTAGNIVIEQYV